MAGKEAREPPFCMTTNLFGLFATLGCALAGLGTCAAVDREYKGGAGVCRCPVCM